METLVIGGDYENGSKMDTDVEIGIQLLVGDIFSDLMAPSGP